METNTSIINAVALFLTGLSSAVDQKILPLESARWMAKTILRSNGFLPNFKGKEEKIDASSEKTEG